MDLPQHIRIAGTFVIFQGVYGDGMCNTIDCIERFVSMFSDSDTGGPNNNNNNYSSVITTNHDSANQEQSLQEIPSENTTVTGEGQPESSSASGSRVIVTPPPSYPEIPTVPVSTATVEASDEASNYDQYVHDDNISRNNDHEMAASTTTAVTKLVSENYIPPTKVAKTSTTMEETIAAISIATINSDSSFFKEHRVAILQADDNSSRLRPLLSSITKEVETEGYVVLEDSVLNNGNDEGMTTGGDTTITWIERNAGNAMNEPLKTSSDEREVIDNCGDFNELNDDDNKEHQLLTRETDIVAQQWARECRVLELYHRKEWYENAISQTDSRTEKDKYISILHPQHCVAYTGNSYDDNTGNIEPSIPWWMSPDTGCVAILDQLPTPPIRIQTPSLFGIDRSPEIMLPSSQCNRIASLSPGTIVIATELVTLCSHNINPEMPMFTPIEIVPINDEDEEIDRNEPHNTSVNNSHNNNTESESTTKIYLPGRLGWIQILKIISPICGYCVLSIDGYAFAGPGLPHHYIPSSPRGNRIDQNDDDDDDFHRNADATTDRSSGGVDNNHQSLEGWYWRVMCIEGAYVRDGLDLTTEHVATIPYGSLVRVLRKSINDMGLSRLQIETIYYPTESNNNSRRDDQPQHVTGWISEFLNPLSGQRGSIVLPLPFPVPASYVVTLPEGAVIRSDVELSSPEIGHAPFGTILSIIGCTYSEQPKDQCIARYRLAGNGGYINVKLNVPSPHDYPVVQFVGIDNKFNSDEPNEFHCHSIQKNIEPHPLECSNATDTTNINRPQQSSMAVPQCRYTVSSHLRMVGTNNRIIQQQRQLLQQSRGDDNTGDITDESNTAIQSNRSNVSVDPMQHYGSDGTGMTILGVRKGTGNAKCVICLCEDRTATIIHSETGHIACCLMCARILKARGDPCPVCRLPIDMVIQHFWA